MASIQINQKKALGQYFTEFTLARLLSRLAYRHQSPSSVIDPMCGKGDMLLAARYIFGESTPITGLDIDPAVVMLARERLGNSFHAEIHEGNTFDLKTWEHIGLKQHNLVITNPPYVRYQSQRNLVSQYGLPNASEVRNGLISIAKEIPFDSLDDKEFFIQIIRGYSGLSDLAVPSWILCAMLTQPGGRLAMVVPEAWLSRDYAAPIQWLLQNYFRLLFVVEDANRSWFKQAQIKTNLIVAERNGGTDTQPTQKNRYYIFASLSHSNSPESVVKHLYPQDLDADNCFSEDMFAVLENGPSVGTSRPFPYELRDLDRERAIAWQHIRKIKRLSKSLSGHPETETVATIGLPQGLVDLLAGSVPSLVSLGDLGVVFGQGLRTGANNFFYLTLKNTPVGAGNICLVASKALDGMIVIVPKNITYPVLRYQSELPLSKKAIDETSLMGRVICLSGYGLPEDIENISTPSFWQLIPVPPTLAEYIRKAATSPAQIGKEKFVPQMSAVKTNENLQRGSFWYCLPPFTDRHRPEIIIPRVNHQPPSAWLNPGRSTVIDANFTSVWLTPRAGQRIDVWSLLAILNSQWAQAFMELSGSVMGGGALKLEASHLRHFPIPSLQDEDLHRLSAIGQEMALGNLKAADEGNRILVGRLVKDRYQKTFLDELSAITQTHLRNRGKKHE